MITELNHIDKYFTDTEELRSLFQNLIQSKKMNVHILSIHGLPGVGKSSLLTMYEFSCKTENMPVGTASYDQAADAILATWVSQLECEDIHFTEYTNTFQAYEQERKVASEAISEVRHAGSHAAATFGAKTIEAAAGGTVALVTASLPPEVSIAATSLVTGIVGTGAERLFEYVAYRKDSKQIQKLSGDRQGDLTGAFLGDLARAAGRRRIVLMLDAFDYVQLNKENVGREKASWALDLLKDLPANILFVLCGRSSLREALLSLGRDSTPDTAIRQEELLPMKSRFMEELAYRYYDTQQVRRKADKNEMDQIIQFARGLPLALTTSITLWVDFGYKDFSIAKREDVLPDLMLKLIKGIPADLLQVLYAVSILRWFNAGLVAALVGKEGAYEKYLRIRSFPFVYKYGTYGSGNTYAVHFALRELIDEHLALNESKQHELLHGKAVEYFLSQLKNIDNKMDPADYEQSLLELIYHSLEMGNEEAALDAGRAALEYAFGFHNQSLMTTVRSLLWREVKTDSGRHWLNYLDWLISRMDPNIVRQQTASKALIDLLDQPELNPRLRFLIVLALADVPGETHISPDQRIRWLEEAMQSNALQPLDLAKGHLQLANVYRERGDWTIAVQEFSSARQLYVEHEDPLGMIYATDGLAYTHLLTGNWQAALQQAKDGEAMSKLLHGYMRSTTLKTLGWVYTYAGDLEKGRLAIQEALEIAEARNAQAEKIRLSRRLAEIYDRKKQWSLSNPLYGEYIEIDRGNNREISMATFQALLGSSYVQQGKFQEAEALLQASLGKINLHNRPFAELGLGQLYLFTGDLQKAQEQFDRIVSNSTGRPYYSALARLGAFTIALQRGQGDTAHVIAQELEDQSKEYLYFDILAVLYLAEANSLWNGSDFRGTPDLDTVYTNYQKALVSALRYNVILLDDILNGHPLGFTVSSLLSNCLRHQAEGREMLKRVRDWWLKGITYAESDLFYIGMVDGEPINLLDEERRLRNQEFHGDKTQILLADQLKHVLG